MAGMFSIPRQDFKRTAAHVKTLLLMNIRAWLFASFMYFSSYEIVAGVRGLSEFTRFHRTKDSNDSHQLTDLISAEPVKDCLLWARELGLPRQVLLPRGRPLGRVGPPDLLGHLSNFLFE